MRIEWSTPTRYYTVILYQDLIEDWRIRCSWGGRFNNLHGKKEYIPITKDEAKRLIKIIKNRRERRGYQIMQWDGFSSFEPGLLVSHSKGNKKGRV